jgi:hypothetical protein
VTAGSMVSLSRLMTVCLRIQYQISQIQQLTISDSSRRSRCVP